MKRFSRFVLLAAAAALVLGGCQAGRMKPAFTPMDISGDVKAGVIAPGVSNFIVVFDASSSMGERDRDLDQSKFASAKDFLAAMNMTLPPGVFNGAIRSFGHGSCMPKDDTLMITPFAMHSMGDITNGSMMIKCAGGTSPLSRALDAVKEDLKGLSGRTAVIVLSDGEDMNDTGVKSAKALEAAYGGRVCIHTVHFGDDEKGEVYLRSIASAVKCGSFTKFEDAYDGGAMAVWVKNVFYSRGMDQDKDGVFDVMDKCPDTPMGAPVDRMGCPRDSDKDGVFDYLDKCPDTLPVKVDEHGCPLDSDGDGVWDHKDACKNTPKGTPVDMRGCPKDTDKDGVIDTMDQCPGTPMGAKVNSVGCWVVSGVTFDTGKWTIKKMAEKDLVEIAYILKRNPDLSVEILGHTDSVGKDEYNMRLSDRRARAVMRYLHQQGIPTARMSAKGLGETRPMASNDTAEGRAMNRRVELMPKMMMK